MSLKNVHVMLISLSSLLAFLFGGWLFRGYRELGGSGKLAAAALSIAVGLGLIVYVVWFIRKVRTKDDEERRRRKLIRPLVVPVAVWMLSTYDASACPVCYGEAEGPMIDAARLGVFLLFGLVLAVQIALVIFFLHLRKRAKAFPLRAR